LFGDPSSKEQIIDGATFDPPSNFENSLKKIQETYPEINITIQ